MPQFKIDYERSLSFKGTVYIEVESEDPQVAQKRFFDSYDEIFTVDAKLNGNYPPIDKLTVNHIEEVE